MQTLKDSIRNTPLFADSMESTVETLCDSSMKRLRCKPKGTYVTHMNDPCDYLLVLIEGNVYASMTNDEGKEIVVETMTGPLVLAPAFVFAHSNVFPVNIVTETDCTFMYVDKSLFAQLLEADSNLMMSYITVLSDRCHRLTQHVNSVSLMSLKQRVIDYLKVNGRIESVQWMARVLGVTRPSLSRVISELKAEGQIERTLDGIVMTEK